MADPITTAYNSLNLFGQVLVWLVGGVFLIWAFNKMFFGPEGSEERQTSEGRFGALAGPFAFFVKTGVILVDGLATIWGNSRFGKGLVILGFVLFAGFLYGLTIGTFNPIIGLIELIKAVINVTVF